MKAVGIAVSIGVLTVLGCGDRDRGTDSDLDSTGSFKITVQVPKTAIDNVGSVECIVTGAGMDAMRAEATIGADGVIRATVDRVAPVHPVARIARCPLQVRSKVRPGCLRSANHSARDRAAPGVPDPLHRPREYGHRTG